jgi:hypothetical protein
MQPKLTSNQIFASGNHEIEIDVIKTDHAQETIDAMRESLIRIAKAKSGLKVVTLSIDWNVDGNCYNERVTG